MWMRRVWIRFYKSFNYDYDYKAHPETGAREWELTADGWRPFVTVGLESDITAVVGANESGKTHLLDAINIVLTGEGLHVRDFCRYSTLFSVERGKRLYPEVGATFALTDVEAAGLRGVGIPLLDSGDLQMFRRRPELIEVLDKAGKHVTLTETQVDYLTARLPYAHKLDTQVDLPDAVSIAALAGQDPLRVGRAQRLNLLRLVQSINTEAELTQKVGTIFALMTMIEDEQRRLNPDKEQRKQELGRDLLLNIARIDPRSFAELASAITDHREGLVNGLIQEMNRSIARHLNISRWWSQDADFQLRISPREHELVFTIRDRTGTDYSFSERSRGLTYFLSYYVQLRSHERPDDRPEVLLMDEPDAYLSALGQQDLLRVLEDHAKPEDGNRRDQVVYVTHSPFLINRNAGHRVRVLDKGTRDQGTRLVKSVTQTHYEPLRTSLGPSVAETAFIGGENLFVEGITDQVLLTAMNARLIRAEVAPSQRLDLNKVTIVPGGADVAYMLYLARGRDPHKPACAVLLDTDPAGRQAHKAIKNGGKRGRPTVPDDLIVMLGDWAADADVITAPGVVVEEPEDLIPLNLAGIAARNFARTYLGLSKAEADKLTDEAIAAEITTDQQHMWNAVYAAIAAVFDAEATKLGFAKELLAYLDEHESDQVQPAGVEQFMGNYAKLLATLAGVLRLAREREDDHHLQERVQRIIDDFVDAHPKAATRDSAEMMLELLEAALDDSAAADSLAIGVTGLRREFELTIDPLTRVANFEEFTTRLSELPRIAELIGEKHLENIKAGAAAAEVPEHGAPPPDLPSNDSDEPPADGSTPTQATDSEADAAGAGIDRQADSQWTAGEAEESDPDVEPAADVTPPATPTEREA